MQSITEESCQVNGAIDRGENHSVNATENHSTILHNITESSPPACSSLPPQPYQELRMLSEGTEARKSQIRQVLIDLEGAHKRLEELQYTIHIKVT